jgi:aldehyde:ferredoxin oxidoreductase
MADKTMPTPGEWCVTSHCTVLVPYRLTVQMTLNGEWAGEKEANARLIAAAGTAAHECAEMGYDPIEAVGALPRVLELLNEARVELGSQALGNMDEPDLSDAADRVAKNIADLMADICRAACKEDADQSTQTDSNENDR